MIESSEKSRLAGVSVIPFAVLVLVAGSSLLVSLKVTISMTAQPLRIQHETKMGYSLFNTSTISPDIALQDIQKPQLVIVSSPTARQSAETSRLSNSHFISMLAHRKQQRQQFNRR